MLVSWNWLKEYVPLNMELAELENRLAMSGLNHEETRQLADDIAIDLEVTSNRADCLGHIGIAREVAVLWDLPLQIPEPVLDASAAKITDHVRVRIQSPALCPRYVARLIRGVEVGPSPDWLVARLEAVGIASVNNVVDVTNYVLLECGQPLHAFDLAKLAGPEIIVREALDGEQFTAINHHTYTLKTGMCVIADARRPVALGGVMGGEDSEISAHTQDVLLEAADFEQLSIRNTARHLNLHSPSSYRFERGVDPEGIDWASQRCCELILELAGGELVQGAWDVVGRARPTAEPIVLRWSQLRRILGIEVPPDDAARILTALGNTTRQRDDQSITLQPPSWRRDLTREIDLVEEVARIHGYEQIPEDARVPMVPSHRSDRDRVVGKVRECLTALGFDEAMTASVVSEEWSDVFSPWSEQAALQSSTPMLRGADRLRRSLLPSLLGARSYNEKQSNPVIELFEIAKVYLPRPGKLPAEPGVVSLTSGQDFYTVKGCLQTVLARLNPRATWATRPYEGPLLDGHQACWLLLDGKTVGVLGQVDDAAAAAFGLRGPTVVAEVQLDPLQETACLIPQYHPPSPFPTMDRDLNLIVDESLTWARLADTVRDAAGTLLESLHYRETYRDPEKRDGENKKRLMFSMTFRHAERTLTSEEVDQACGRVIEQCRDKLSATLVG